MLSALLARALACPSAQPGEQAAAVSRERLGTRERLWLASKETAEGRVMESQVI